MLTNENTSTLKISSMQNLLIEIGATCHSIWRRAASGGLLYQSGV